MDKNSKIFIIACISISLFFVSTAFIVYKNTKTKVISSPEYGDSNIAIAKTETPYKITTDNGVAKISSSKTSVSDLADVTIIDAADAEYSINAYNEMLEDGYDKSYISFKAASGTINGNPAWLYIYQRGSSDPAYLYEKLPNGTYSLVTFHTGDEKEILDLAKNLYFFETDKPNIESDLSDFVDSPDSNKTPFASVDIYEETNEESASDDNAVDVVLSNDSDESPSAPE